MSPGTDDDGRRDLALVLGPGDRVAVTGASGFIGSAVLRVLLGRDVAAVALVEPGADRTNLEGLDVEQVQVDVRDAEGMGRALRGARAVFHVAALYRFWARDNRQFYDVNVGGTLHVLDAVRSAGVERMVYTSTVGTLGLDGAHRSAADERNYPDVSHLFGSYKRSKYVAEHEVLRAAAQGVPVTIVMPTFPLGPRDRVPTPTGRLVLDYLNGRVPGYVDTTLNVAHVDDVAAGHVLALERGDIGRSYILGGENYSLQHLLGDPRRLHRSSPGQAARPPVAVTRCGPCLGARRGTPAAAPSLGPTRSGPDVDDADGVRRLPGPQGARLRAATGRGGRGRLGPVVRRQRLRQRGPTRPDHVPARPLSAPVGCANAHLAALTPALFAAQAGL